jgi:hypothetical protein
VRLRTVPLTALLVLLTACGGDDKPRAATAAKPTVTPYPSIDLGDLENGASYASRKFQPELTLTIPQAGEWHTAGADNPDHVELEPEPVPPVSSSGISFHHMTRVFPPDEGGVIPGDAVAGPADFAAWLTSHPHLRTTRPKPVEALGLKGVSIDVRVKSSQSRKYKDCGKVEGECVVMFIGSVEPLVYGSKTFGRFYVLDQPGGKQLVVEEFAEPASAFKKTEPQLDAVLRSARVAG